MRWKDYIVKVAGNNWIKTAQKRTEWNIEAIWLKITQEDDNDKWKMTMELITGPGKRKYTRITSLPDPLGNTGHIIIYNNVR